MCVYLMGPLPPQIHYNISLISDTCHTQPAAHPAVRTMQFPPPPAAVEFRVENVAPYHHMFNYRYLSVNWRNLASGATGTVKLRHWRDLRDRDTPVEPGSPASLPTSASAVTGGGPVVATVSVTAAPHGAPHTVNSLIPGLIAIDVPR